MTATKRGPGRPPLWGEPQQHIGLRLPSSIVAEIDEAAGESGQGRSEWIRQVLRRSLAGRQRKKQQPRPPS